MLPHFTLPLLLIMAAPEPPEPTLQWKFKEGDVFFLRTEGTTKATSTIEGTKQEHTTEDGGVSRFTVKKVNKDGSVTIKEDILKSVLKLQGKDFNPVIDAMEGTTFVFTIRPGGEIEDFQGAAEFVKKLKPQAREKETTQDTERMFKHALAQRFSIFPRKALSQGDTWERKSKVDRGPSGIHETTTKYKYEGKTKVGGVMLDRVTWTSTDEIRTANLQPGDNPPFRLTACKITEQESKGTLLFDSSTGRLHEETVSQKSKMTQTFESGKRNTEFEAVHDKTSKVTLLKEYP